ncbi:hypothetical protein BDV93DRAFT_603916, partial [Ceratobasidium sp. AG-I]
MRQNYIECSIVDISHGARLEERSCSKLMDSKNTLQCNITPQLNTEFAIIWKSVAPFGHKRGYGLACTPWLDGIRMPTHVVRPADLANRTRWELAGEKSATQFRPFYFGEPKIIDSDELASRDGYQRPEAYTIKLVLEWLPNCNSVDERYTELGDLPENSEFFNIPYFKRSQFKEVPSIFAQLGKPIPIDSERAQVALAKATPRISSFRVYEVGKHECVTFIFHYKPG